MFLRTERSLSLSVTAHKTPTDLRRAGVNQCAFTEALASISASVFVFSLSWKCLSAVFFFYLYVYVLFVCLFALGLLQSHFGLLFCNCSKWIMSNTIKALLGCRMVRHFTGSAVVVCNGQITKIHK